MKQRMISAIVVLSIFIPIFLVGGFVFNLFTILLGVLALKELIQVREPERQLTFGMKLYTILLFLVMVINIVPNTGYLYAIDYRIITLLIISLLVPIIIYNDEKKYNIEDAFFLLASIFFLGLSFRLFILIREYSLVHFIYIILITTMSDTYAYISGSLIGKHKLIETISPKKTVEGILFGTLFGVLISSCFYYIYINDAVNIWYLLGLSTLLSLVASMGDLVFSAIKRKYHKKDYSNLMPGHGGALDRLDSIIFVVLVYILFISMK